MCSRPYGGLVRRRWTQNDHVRCAQPLRGRLVLDDSRRGPAAVRREKPLELARQTVRLQRAGPRARVDATAIVTAEPLAGANLEPKHPARLVECPSRHAFQHPAPGLDPNVGGVEDHSLDHGEARAEVPDEDDGAVAAVENQSGCGVNDERPRQDAGRREEVGHARFTVRRRGLMLAKVAERGNGKTRSNVARSEERRVGKECRL